MMEEAAGDARRGGEPSRRAFVFALAIALGACGDGARSPADTSDADTSDATVGDTSDATDSDTSDAADGDTSDAADGDTSDATDTSDVSETTAYQVRYEGRWDDDEALFGIEPPPLVPGAGRPGAALGPQAIAVGPLGLVVLDPARDRLVRLDIDSSGTSVLAQDPFFHGAQDLFVDPDGVTWALGSAACGCVRRVDGTNQETPVVPEALGYRLMGDGDGFVYLGAPDGAARWNVHVLSEPRSLEQQRATGGDVDPPASVMAINWGARVPSPPDDTLELVDPYGGTRRIPLPGRPLEVELFEVAFSETCAVSFVVVVTVLADDALVHAMVRTDLSGEVIHTASAPAALGLHQPFRPFALLPEGRLFQLRADGDGYAIVEWNIGCP